MKHHVFTSQTARPAKALGRSGKRTHFPRSAGKGLYGILFLGSLILFGIDQANHRLAEKVREFATDLSLPVLETTSHVIVTVRSFLRTTRDYADLAGEYERLREQNRRLKAQRGEARIVEARARAYETLLNYAPRGGLGAITARTIADVKSPFVHSIIVDAGRDNGVLPGLAVVGGSGLVGRIISTGRKTARVLLVTDVNSRVPVFVGSARHRAILAGTNGLSMTLMHLPASAILEKGDMVVTSGEGRLLPAGLTVGRVRIVRNGQPEIALERLPLEADMVRILKTTMTADVDPTKIPLPVALSANVPQRPTPKQTSTPGAVPQVELVREVAAVTVEPVPQPVSE